MNDHFAVNQIVKLINDYFSTNQIEMIKDERNH